MNKPLISMVVAIGEKTRVMGKNNHLPWNIPEDMKHFKDLTRGHAIVMGRKTYESIGRPLPNRTNIIITRDTEYKATGCIVVSSIEEAIDAARKVEKTEICIIGGGEIFKQSMNMADILHLTLVKGDIEGDTFFPDYSEFKTTVSQKESASNGYQYTFIDLTR